MRPIRLELSGLNSYIDKSVVDFEKLTDRGLFGIFGKTGSGKSTILDAMTIAMYGSIPRNTKEFINSSCDKAIISYEFEIGSKNAKRRYKVDRTIVRTNTGTKTSYSRLIEMYEDESEKVLADKVGEVNNKIAEIVGLTANDFMRSVVLPQGKFNDFLKLAGADRRDMLERIFNLEKYGRGLIDKVKKRKNVQQQALRDINSKLSQYDTVSEEVYNQVQKELEELRSLEISKNKDFEINQNKYKEVEEIYEKQVKLENYKKRKHELDLKQEDISKKGRQLEDALNADKINPYINAVLELEKRVNEDSLESQNLEKKLELLNKELLITKANYEEAYKNKNENMPRLSEDRIKLQNAIELEAELVGLDSELKDIKGKGIGLNQEKEILIKLKEDLESKKEIVINNLKSLEEKISEIKISADLKQKIFLAYEYEKEYNKLSESKTVKNNRLNEINKNLDEINLKLRYIQRDKDSVLKKLTELEEHYEILIKKSPGTNEEIVNKTEYIANLRVKAESIKENEIKKEDLHNNLNKILENRHQVERELHTLNDKLEVNHTNITYLEKELEKLKYLNLATELRKELKENSPCPVCGSRNHEHVDDTNYNENIEFTKSKIEKLKEDESNIKVKIEELNRKNSECISVEKIILKELEEVKSKIGDLSSNELIKKVEEESKRLDILKVNLQNWNKDKEENESSINKAREEKNKIEKDELILQESINSYKKNIIELKEELAAVEENYKTTKENYLTLKAITKIQDLEVKVEEINNNEKALEDLNNEYLKISKSKEAMEKDIVNYQNNLHKIELDLIQAIEIYSEKKKVRDGKYNEIIATTKGESPKLLLENLENNINKLISQEEMIKDKLEAQRLEFEKTTSDKSNIDGRLKIAKEQYKIQTDTLNKSLDEYKFESIYAVKRSLLDKEYLRKLHDEITQYEEEQKVLGIKINDLVKSIGDRRINEKDFNELKDSIDNLKIEISRISQDIGSKQTILSTLKESLDKIKDLNKELKAVQHKVDLLDDLDKIVQGNRFVEYVATNQLKYIALEASNRLESITKGRYALEIDSTLNFVMRDNFNGGQRRSVDTLSGGETFLTSLSLALALSSQIQLKGSAPLEFFFLDEGFGSLDSELLETVIESLERLHHDKLSVGIITHVEELKNRVPIKLIVSPSEVGQGSKVKIEYS